MTVRRIFSAVAMLVMLVGAGCRDRDSTAIAAEVDEPFYVQGKQLVKQGRNPEALTAFLKVIDRRGERGAPESHLEAGAIYLYHTKDPAEAYHHFRRYLDLQPNSKEAVRVKGMVTAALRELARTLPGRPLEDQSQKLQAEETIQKLQKENEELRAQVATLRGSATSPLARGAPTISLPEEIQPKTNPPPVAPVVDRPGVPVTSGPPRETAAPVTRTPTPTTTRPTPPQVSPKGGRTYTVKQGEGLYAIARQFDSANTNRKVKEIVDANPDVLTKGVNTPLKPGMVLKIP